MTAAKTAAKSTPAKAADTTVPVESEASKASRIAPIDFSTIKPAKVAVPQTTRTGGGRTGRDNSMVEGWLRDLDTFRNGEKVNTEARALESLPAESFGEVRTRFVTAAATLGIGVSFLVDALDSKGDTIETGALSKLPDNAVTFNLTYWTKVRKVKAATVKAVTGKAPEDSE